MNIVLLSGGSGKRLWPLSNTIRSKQFIKLFKDEEGNYESMLQRMVRNLKQVDNDLDLTIATSKTQVSAIHNQLGEDVSISIEPCRRDTFPAILLATCYLHDVKKIAEDEIVIVCPVDPYVNTEYFEALKKLETVAQHTDANLFLMGMEPTYPSEKYGYIIPKNDNEISEVASFKEKPTKEKAVEYIENKALWNGGIFAFRIQYLLEKAHQLLDFTDYDDLFSRYETLEKISFDYAIVEKEENIKVIRFNGEWKDLGTWNTLTEAMEDKVIGNAILNDTCQNVHVINELKVPILCMGLQNIVVAASPEGIIVSDKEQSSYIKPYVDQIDDKVMFAEKSWGSFKVIDIQDESMTLLVTLNKGNQMKYHSHDFRSEVWTIVSGNGRIMVDDIEKSIQTGDVVELPIGCKHTIIADTELKLIEVQIGKEINVDDKTVHKVKRFQ